jgi:hypothetical protein
VGRGIGFAALLLVVGCSEAVTDAPPAPAPPAEEKKSEELLAWGFEPASADCNGWAVRGADAIRASPPRSGAYSCKLCATGNTIDLGLDRELGAVPRGRYVLSAWVRKRPQNAAPSEAIARIEADASGVTRRAEAIPVAVREEWDRLETTLDLDDDATNLRITIGAPTAEAERCLFVDDVLLTRL